VTAGRNFCIASSTSAREREAIEAADVSERIEHAFATIAGRIIGTRQTDKLVVAGGETSGAVINALGIRAAEVTGTLDPGVPSLAAVGDAPISLALKSGNFGSADFFVRAARHWDSRPER
jgi:3-dehydrotetronate 4-kinase